ncbi:unnamed protein product [Didymodactylos carnosus]|uniref:NAD(P)(+)--arginine ADP-ribosyltransferase n=1 Tax=Didymodactylos carnosus TaxID=1234261 RepID=A0A814VQG1_9BILA|nr:unnamed protein product [Didymodactylos carnosus]CAF3955211.1 unnamed protein product [Didymodactylos carnosus]
MGNNSGTRFVAEKGNASEFYWTCRGGDTERVEEMLKGMTREEISKVEQNGSTALHVACYYGHTKIIKMLLERGCDRSVINTYSQTAFSESSCEEVRELFERSDSDKRRFMDPDVRDSFSIVHTNKTLEKSDMPYNYVNRHKNVKVAKDAQLMTGISKSIFKKFVQARVELPLVDQLEEIVNKSVFCDDSVSTIELIKTRELLNKFKAKGKKSVCVNALLTLYTLETKFYEVLRHNAIAFTSIIYMHLSELEDRAYKGYSYRGVAISSEDLKAYNWVHSDKKDILETCTVQSTSKNIARAESFAEKAMCSDKHKTIFQFNFPEKCATAIELRELSNYPVEEEVLVLPFTLFEVDAVKITDERHIVYLTNVPVPDKSAFANWIKL